MAAQITITLVAPNRLQAPEVFIPTADTWAGDLTPWTDQANALSLDVNANSDSAESSAASASFSASAAASSANFKGNWSALTGALNIPASVQHNGSTWNLLVNLADVTLSEPGVTSDWALVGLNDDDLALIQASALSFSF